MPEPEFPPMRATDRWLTPWTLVAIVAILGLVVLGIAAGLVYLASIGKDPSPVLDMVTKVGTAAGALIAAGATLLSGARTAKVERNTGVQAHQLGALADAVYEVADALPRPTPRGAHAYPTTEIRGAAPAPRGS